MTRAALASALFLIAATATAADPRAADLAVRARATLAKYCGDCHSGKTGSRPQLDLLDFPKATDPARAPLPPFIAAGAPARSQVIEFLDAGIMPPAGRPRPSGTELADLKLWIELGAAGYPREFDDNFALATILKDVESLPPVDRPFVRYLTLHHLAAASPASPLEPRRQAVAEAIAKVSPDRRPLLTPADSTATVLRFDLRSVGWEARPFQEIMDDKPVRPSAVTVFDVVLLEYPIGVVPAESEVTRMLAGSFLVPAAQVRPVPFVAADWLIGALSKGPLGKDVTELLAAVSPGPSVPNAAEPKLTPANTAAPPRLQLGPKPVPVPAVDGWFTGDTPDDTAAFNLKVETTNAATVATRTFHPGGRLKVILVADTVAHFELVWLDSIGNLYSPALPKGILTVADQDVVLTPADDKQGFELGDPLGKERLTVFAAKKPLPRGVRLATVPKEKQPLKTFKPIERFVHQFRFDGSTDTAAPAEVVRRSVEIEIVKAEKK